ncbi:MAG: 30S ribosomal protein S27e [Candidatus Aenigmarchaeota archaeon]|nr:30S ribosomal protein S27e [Candidatus Aenigmarchaeota archaeon]
MKPGKTKFWKVKCTQCRNEQVIFSKASIHVKCLVCDSILAYPKGGIAELAKGKTELLQEMS